MKVQKKSAPSSCLAALALLGMFTVLLLVCFTVTDGKVLESAIDFYQTGTWWDDDWQEHDSLAGMTFTFKPYGTVVAAGVLAALSAAFFLDGRKHAKRYCVFSLIAVIGGLALSRLLYCAICPFYYTAHYLPSGTLFRLWDGGMSMVGALLGVLLAGVLVPDSRGCVPLAAPLLIAGARMAERFSNQIGHGFQVGFDNFLSVERGWGYRLNVHFIETVMALLIFGMVLLLPAILRGQTDGKRGAAMRMPAFLTVYGITQILMESLRKDEHMVWGFVKVQMILYLFMAMLGMAMVCYGGKPLTDFKRNRWCYGLLVSMISAVLLIGFEFALDKSDIPDGLIYVFYVLVLIFYLVMFFRQMRRRLQPPKGMEKESAGFRGFP